MENDLAKGPQALFSSKKANESLDTMTETFSNDWTKEIEKLKRQRDVMLKALKEIEAHHVEQNNMKGHDQSRSKTLRIARHALAEVTDNA